MSASPSIGVIVTPEGLSLPFIDDSGSSCASSTLGGRTSCRDEDSVSLSHLLDDAVSRELSFNDLASLSCGYSSQEVSGMSEECVIEKRLKASSQSPVWESRCSTIESAEVVNVKDIESPQLSQAKVIYEPYSSEESSSSGISYATYNIGSDAAFTTSSNTSEEVKTRPTVPPRRYDPNKPPVKPLRKNVIRKNSMGAKIDIVVPTRHRRVHSLSVLPNPFVDAESPQCSTPIVHSEPTKDSLSDFSIKDVSTIHDDSVSVHSECKSNSINFNSEVTLNMPQDDETKKPLQTTLPTPPHHYISSLRVSSRGTADMGGALVSRVATFLKSQYKSLVSSPTCFAWCHSYKVSITDFEASLVQIPINSYQKVPLAHVTVPALLQCQVQLQLNESSVEDRPKRVLVEGEVGYCSSHICYKMASDWATSPPPSYMAGYRLVFIVTLRDFRGGSLFSHMCKEILPRHILSREAMNTLWSHMEKIEDKVLFLLVGYDELTEDETDLHEVIEGQMFPGASVVIASRIGAPINLPLNLHRRYLLTGLNVSQTETFIARYLNTFGKLDCFDEAAIIVKMMLEKYSDISRCPVMCLAVCMLYEDLSKKLPFRLADFFLSLIKHMARTNLLRRGEPMCYGALPEKYCKLLQDFGKLALEGLKNNNPYFTGAELKTKVSHGVEIVNLGILVRMKSMSKLNKKEHYAPAHISFLEFVSAFYLAGLVQYPVQLQTELDGLAAIADITNMSSRTSSGIMVLRYLAGLLGRNAYVALNILSQMGISHRLLFLLLWECGYSQMNVLEVCKNVSGREHVVIQTNSGELQHWGRLLYSPDCSLEGIEVILDFDGSSRERHESFFTSMSFNESVRSVKLTCLVGGDFGQSEVTRLVSYVRSVLTKKRLESFELLVTSLEDSTAEILNPVVDMICDTLPELAKSLTKLVLSLDLDSDQVVRLCDVMVSSPQVKFLHLPHLACGIKGLKAVARVVHVSPLVSLNLAGTLSNGTPIEERSGIGFSFSSSESQPLAFWSFVDAQGNKKSVFNSLPRSFYQSLPRNRRLNSISGDKRNSDTTLLQRTSFPPPTCDPEGHQSGFHDIFDAFKSSDCRVCHLNINKCTLGAEDLVCLGETLRFSTCLSSLKMEGLSRMAELIPILIALQTNKSLQLLDLSSPHVLLGDAAFQVTLNCLKKNKSLRLLVINGWTLQLENERSLLDFVSFMSSSEFQHLDVSGCKVVTSIQEGALAKQSRHDDVTTVLQNVLPPLYNNKLAFLKMDHFEVHLNNKVILRGPQLIFLLRNLPKLVDLSLASNLGSCTIGDTGTNMFFSLLPTAFPCLRKLNIAGWIFSIENCDKSMKHCGKSLRHSRLRELHLSGVQVRESSGKAEMEYTLLSAFTSNLHHLDVLSLSGIFMSQNQAALLGKIMKEKLVSRKLDLETKGLSYQSIKSLRQTLTEGGRFDLSFVGGPTGLYQINRIERKEKILSKWACISTTDK